MIGSGVLAGAIKPFQASASTSRPVSFSVGTPGRSAERWPSEMAKILTVPEDTCGTTEIAGKQAICTSLRRTAVIACGEPGEGRWAMGGALLGASAPPA